MCKNFIYQTVTIVAFLQRVSIACYADSEGSTLKHNYVKTSVCRPTLSAA